MNNKALQILEYNKIIDRLTDKATSEPGRTLCRDLLPMTALEEIEHAEPPFQKRVHFLWRK